LTGSSRREAETEVDELIQLIRAQAGPEVTIHEGTPIISSGIVDSFKLVWLIDALETKFGVSIDPGQVGVDNFDTPAQILAFIQARQ
jgi:acyl carrier protein